MRATLLTAALLLGAGIAQAQDVSGSYDVEGTNLDGSSYKGTATIVMISDTTCEIAWVTGSTTSEGICMVLGDTMAAGYALTGGVGLVVYERAADGTLNGVWTGAGLAGSGTEVLTPRSA